MGETVRVWKTGKSRIVTIPKSVRILQNIDTGDWVEVDFKKIKTNQEVPEKIPNITEPEQPEEEQKQEQSMEQEVQDTIQKLAQLEEEITIPEQEQTQEEDSGDFDEVIENQNQETEEPQPKKRFSITNQ